VTVKNIIKILKATSDENRLRILKILEKRELCVCELQVLLGLSQPAVSHHLKVLYNAGLIDYSKEGLFVNYRLSKREGPDVERVRKVLLEALADKEEMRLDLDKVESVHREEILKDAR
jgi:ArsR family transcriptional regulator